MCAEAPEETIEHRSVLPPAQRGGRAVLGKPSMNAEERIKRAWRRYWWPRGNMPSSIAEVLPTWGIRVDRGHKPGMFILITMPANSEIVLQDNTLYVSTPWTPVGWRIITAEKPKRGRPLYNAVVQLLLERMNAE